MKILTFTGNTCDEFYATLIGTLERAGYATFVDGVHGKHKDWFLSQFSDTPHRCYFFDQDFCMTTGTVNDLHFFFPAFVIYFDKWQDITAEDWKFIDQYMSHLFYNDELPVESERSKELLLGATIISHQSNQTEEDMSQELPQHYSFDRYDIPDRDISLIQIGTPNCEIPYTVCIRDFSKRGLKPLFTSLFVSQSWGVSRSDISFLQELWNNLMQGEFDLHGMLKETTEACYPQPGRIPDPEPEVYRRTIEQVLNTFAERESGTAERVNHDKKNL